MQRAGGTKGWPRPRQKVHPSGQRNGASKDATIHPEFLVERQHGWNRDQEHDRAGAIPRCRNRASMAVPGTMSRGRIFADAPQQPSDPVGHDKSNVGQDSEKKDRE